MSLSIATRLAVAVSLAVLPAAAFADPGKGQGRGHARSGGPVVVIGAPSRGHGAGCPPGLAKKGNGCQPPGQARKDRPVVVEPPIIGPVVVLPQAVRPAPRPVVVAPFPRESTLVITPAAAPVVVGRRYDDIRYVADPRLYGLAPAPEGQRYGIIGNQLVRLDGQTGTVLALVRLVEAILD